MREQHFVVKSKMFKTHGNAISKTLCGLALFTAIVQSITIERRYHRHEYRWFNHFKENYLEKMIF